MNNPILYFITPPTPHTSYIRKKQPRTTEKETDFKRATPIDLACQLDVFWHYYYRLCMDSTHVGNLREVCQVIFHGFLKCCHGMHLESEVIGPCTWAILCTSHTNGHLWMSSSVLFWYFLILKRAIIPSQYLWGFFNPAFKKFFVGGLPTGSWPDMVYFSPRHG